MKFNYLKIILFVFFLTSYKVYSKALVSIIVTIKNNGDLYIPVQAELNEITDLTAEELVLVKVNGKEAEEIPFQISGQKNKNLHWIVDTNFVGNNDSNSNQEHRLVYQLKENTKKTSASLSPRLKQKHSIVHSQSKDGLMTVGYEERNLLGYQFGVMPAPKGVDSSYQRSAFIHPLWSPKGQVLTRVQPKDHYHHYGIWNPWTHINFDGKDVDLWNLAKQQGTVRFGGFKSKSEGAVFNQYQAMHEHVIFSNNNNKESVKKTIIIMNELQTVRVYRPEKNNWYIVDLAIELAAATDKPVTLLKYRYGGFGWRATEQWDKTNSEMLSSTGKTRLDIDNTNGQWFYVQGEIEGAYAGVMMMSHPENFNHPEPMRMWPIPKDERGDVFASFSPTKDRDWKIEPNKTYTQRYRFVVYNGHFDQEKANQAWLKYTNLPEVILSKIYH